jgi:late competence protein required for DNA uptake (superfamily II DNA/RNA helicase)
VQKLLTRISNLNSKNSKKSVRSTKRKCSKCGEEKPLDESHYQVVKSFVEGFSFYCNECSKPKPRD